MKITKLIKITPDMVSTDAVNADADYAPDTTYTEGAKCTHNNRVWLSLQAGNVAHTPGDAAAAAWWSDAGPSNSWALFDGEVGTVTRRAGSLTANISSVRAPVIAALNVRAKEVTITSTHPAAPAAPIYRESHRLWDTSTITNWADYFFNEPFFFSEVVFDDLPLVPRQDIEVFVDGAGSDVEIGMLIAGAPFDVGDELVGLKRSGQDWSSVRFDEFGNADIKKRGYAREISTQTIFDNNQFDRVSRALDSIASIPVLVLSGQPLYTSTFTYGLVSYTIDLAFTTYSFVSIDVKGLI